MDILKHSKLIKASKLAEQLIQTYGNDNSSSYVKVAKELQKIDPSFLLDIDFEKELMKASEEYRSFFKEAALKEGYSEEFVQGVFDTAEKLIKKAGIIDGALKVVGRDALPYFAKNIAPEVEEGAANLLPRRAPDPAVLQPNPERSVDPATIQPQAPQSAFKEQPYKAQSSQGQPQTDSNSNNWSLRNLWNTATLKGNKSNWWKGYGMKAPIAGATVGSLGGALVGAPVAGGIAGGLAGIPGALGARRMLLGAGGAGVLYEGGKGLWNSGAISSGGSAAASGFAQGAGLSGSQPSTDAIPGVGNGLTGGIGGFLLAYLLSKQMGLSGIPGMAMGLLGAYGGYKYMPQLLAKLRANMNNGNYSSMSTPSMPSMPSLPSMPQQQGTVFGPAANAYTYGGSYQGYPQQQQQ